MLQVFFYNSVYFDKDISIYGKINNTEVNNNTTNLATISGNVKYIKSNSVDTILNSRFKIQDVDNPLLYTVMLVNDIYDTSYIKSSLNVSGDMIIDGAITNDALNNTIDSISGKVNTISGQVNTISGQINTISGQINTISGRINTISGQINTISGRINTISGQVNNLNNVITVTGNAQTGYTINIGNALSKIYLNGVNLYYNNEQLLTQDNIDNQVTFGEYINQNF